MKKIQIHNARTIRASAQFWGFQPFTDAMVRAARIHYAKERSERVMDRLRRRRRLLSDERAAVTADATTTLQAKGAELLRIELEVESVTRVLAMHRQRHVMLIRAQRATFDRPDYYR